MLIFIFQASPAFDWTAVDTSQAGADIVTDYLNTDFRLFEADIRKLGKTDLLAPLVSSVAAHIHLIKVNLVLVFMCLLVIMSV